LTTAEDFIDDFVDWMSIEKGRSLATLEAYRRDLRRFAHWMREHHLVVTSLRESDVDGYFSELRTTGAAASSVARAAAALRGWLGYLVEEGHLSSDPSARLRGARRPRPLPKPLEEAEVVALLESVPSHRPIDRRDRALLELLYGTGIRVSEAVGVALEHLDFDEELILVTGKGDRQRLVPMGAALNAALREYLAPGGRGELAGAARTSRLLLNARGAPLTRQGVDLVVRKRALAAGLDRSRVSAHVFRHSCATHMLAHGADIRVVQELLGHVSIATTQIYTAVSVASLQREYQNAHPRAHE
jgi:integrase/recombinase XerD